jgi:hypothetical protein
MTILQASHGRWPYWQILNKPGSTLVAILLALGQSAAVADWLFPAEIIKEPTLDRFSVCFDHSCRTIVSRAFSPGEWQRLAAPLQAIAPTATAERAAIAQAIALMEQIVGEKTGTAGDRGGNLAGFGQPGQMDCIDESNNTTTYLILLQQAGLLKHHVVRERATRFGFRAGMPHTTAVIENIATQQRYAVDSWFFDNGEVPVIMPLDEWKSGWRPDDTGNE